MKNHVKAGYVSIRNLARITEKDALGLNVINIAFGHCSGSEIKFDCGCAGNINSIKKYNPEIKILLSVGGWGSGGFSPMAASEANRKKFAASAVKVLLDSGLDGIDIDWEYPCIDTAGIEASPDDKYNYTYMLAALRNELDKVAAPSGKNPLLTAAVGAGQYFIENTEIDKIADIVDYISIMTYDMRGSWSKITGHHTNLLKPENHISDPGSAEHSVAIYKAAGMPGEKIIIGAAFYSRKWEKVANANNGYLQPAGGTGGYGPDFTDICENYINRNGYTRYWDDIAKAPYLFNGSTFISYDDEQSVEAKCEFVKENGLLGIMYWEHGCDKTGKLLDAINRVL